MSPRKKRSATDVDFLLDDLFVDASGDEEQLTALAQGIAEALDLPADVHVVGEPLSLVAVSYGGNARRGLVARCRRDDGSEYSIGLADVEMAPDAAGHRYLAAYCRWLGVEPAAPNRSRSVKGKLRRHKASGDDIDLSKPVELIVLAVKQRAARCRLPGSERVITLRAGSAHRLVTGQIATVRPAKHWRHSGHPYLSGDIVSVRIDVSALGLTPLQLNRFGDWDPAAEYWGEEDEPLADWVKPIVARGARPMFEMEQVLPGYDLEKFDSDPILEANDLRDAGDTSAAQDILAKLLEADLRCLDAHAHFGNLMFRHSPDQALSHYEVGVRIGELSLGEKFDGVLAWDLIDNRPLLRCLHGHGLCLWRLERWQEAQRVFERLLWLNPADNQGIRFLLPRVRARKAWVDEQD